MRDQILRVETSDGELVVVVKGDALHSLRDGMIFQDGASLVQHYRSVIAEIALEKHAEAGRTSDQVIITRSDLEG